MKRAIQAVLISVAAAAVLFALFVAAAIVVPQHQPTIRQHLVDAIVSGEMNAQTSRFQKEPAYRNVFNCLIFNMMLPPGPGSATEAISNRMVAVDDKVYVDRVPPFPDCQALWRVLPELGGIGGRFIQYNRYVLGTRVVGRALLSVMSVETLRLVLLAVSYALIGSIALIAGWRFGGARDTIETARAAGYLAIAACLALFYGVYYFDTTLVFATLDWVQYIFILISLVRPLDRMRPAGLALYAGSYGSAIAIFEFLTGGIPLALGLLPLLLALGSRAGWREYFGKIVLVWASFCVAVVVTFAIKQVYTVALLGSAEDFFGALFYRVHGEFDFGTIARYSLFYLVAIYYSGAAAIAWGVRHIGPMVITAAVVTIVTLTWRDRSDLWAPRHVVVLACWLSLFAEVAWIAVFLNHAYLHSFYMARLLVVPVMAGAVLVATEFFARRAAAAARAPAT